MTISKAKKILKDVLPWILLLGAAYFYLSEGKGKGNTLAEGIEAPDFVVQTGEGEKFKLSEHRGEVIVLSFWATWCQACKFELPWVSEIEKENRGKGVSILGLSLDHIGLSELSQKAQALDIHLPVGLAASSTVVDYGVSTLPTTYVIDTQGKVSDVFVGVVLKSSIEKAVASASIVH